MTSESTLARLMLSWIRSTGEKRRNVEDQIRDALNRRQADQTNAELQKLHEDALGSVMELNKKRIVIRDGRVLKCSSARMDVAQAKHDELQASHPERPVGELELEIALASFES